MDVNNLFSPFKNQDLCLWFYFLSIAGFVLLVLAVVTGVFIGITTRRSWAFFVSMFFMASTYLIFYFQNRLLYSMCINSI
jgi:MFS-type transporter involved in bile tolerance (Atg22 family)|uniref:Uncharacterized protein n=1 Tax=viral metagenome TaxID=1070528 RepID=A0A6C0DYD9_9ZZZZ